MLLRIGYNYALPSHRWLEHEEEQEPLVGQTT